MMRDDDGYNNNYCERAHHNRIIIILIRVVNTRWPNRVPVEVTRTRSDEVIFTYRAVSPFFVVVIVVLFLLRVSVCVYLLQTVIYDNK